MINTLEVTHFKSIRRLDLAPRRVNVFIGKPNTGKSNILEGLGILSFPFATLKELVRFETMSNLFYDHDLSSKVQVLADPYRFTLGFDDQSRPFHGECAVCTEFRTREGAIGSSATMMFDFRVGDDGSGSRNDICHVGVKFYKFRVLAGFNVLQPDWLLPPDGSNLLAILLHNRRLREEVADILHEFGYRLVLEPQESEIEIQKEEGDVLVSTPYGLVSDTLQRIIFHLAAIETNKNSTLIFEEPESHAFPFYTKLLAERIALDAHNQYFLATHNPYFLTPLVEKTKAGDLAVFVTYYENYETKVKALSDQEVTKLLDLDESVFFNLDKFLAGR